jgi:ABC-type uncharacterized transport system auxiliary subunit
MLIVGCSSEQRVIKFYTLDTYDLNATSIDPEITGDPFPSIAEVARFSVAGTYNQNRIALRTGSHELQFYYYHHWADLPGQAVTYFVWQHLKNARIFAQCEMQYYESVPDFEILGTIHRIERIDMNEVSGAHLSMSLELIRVDDKRIEINHSFERTEPFEHRADMNVFAAAVSKILSEETDVFIRAVRNFLQNSD